MKFKVIEQDAPVYLQPRQDLPAFRILHVGEYADLLKVKNVKGQQWVDVILQDKTRGYITGNTRIFALKRVVTNQPETILYGTAGRESVKATLKKRTPLNYLDLVVQNGEKWIQVQDKSGSVGFIDPATKVLQVATPTVASGVWNVVIGAIATLSGGCYMLSILVTSPINWMELVLRLCWTLLGLTWFIAGIVQIVEASKK
jgi:hypothetical protein